MEEQKTGFVVIDKRGSNNPIQEPLPRTDIIREEAPVQDRKWKSVGYMVCLLPGPNGGTLVMGRAVGLSERDEVYMADFQLSPVIKPGDDWTVDARRRLDSFLTCPCLGNTTCSYHRKVLPSYGAGWFKDDQRRLREFSDQPIPEALEVLFKMERAREQASRVLAPRR